LILNDIYIRVILTTHKKKGKNKMNYTIFNYKGEVLNESVSQDELNLMIESDEFNVFQWGENVYEDFLSKHQYDDAEKEFCNFRVYKLIS
jgi:hypothetical protein